MIARVGAWVMAGWVASAGATGISPHTAWRALIVYTNSIDSLYGSESPGPNLYIGYFASLFDGINQTYEDSEISSRGQIAGVIWDKAYAVDHGPGWGCLHSTDVQLGINGMARHKALLDRYAADVLILVHHAPSPEGCAPFLDAVKSIGHGAVWFRFPNHVYVAAHEVAHNFDANHCHGHRVTLDMYGNEIVGRLPNTLPALDAWEAAGWYYSVADIVESETTDMDRGFHTTMAYNSGMGCEGKSTPGPGFYDLTYLDHSDGDSTRRFRFFHQGQKGGTTAWPGVFANPRLSWYDSSSNTYHSMGHDSARYSRTIKYLHVDTISYRDTVAFHRDARTLHDLNNDTIVNLKDAPDSLIVSEEMSLGVTSADTQWVYAHFVAKKSIRIQPGFRLNGGTTMKVTVGEPSGMLAKRSIKQPDTRYAENASEAIRDKLQAKYDPATQSVVFLLSSQQISKVTVSVFDLKGNRREEKVFHKVGVDLITHSFSVRDLSNGIYLIRVTVGRKSFQQQFVKW